MMVLEIGEEEEEEEGSEFIDPEVQKQRIRQIIEYQKSIFMAYTFSSQRPLLPSPRKGNSSSLLELIEGRRFSLGRLFEMENTSTFQDFSGWSMIKPINLWDNDDGEDEIHDPWMFITRIGPTKELGQGTRMTADRKLNRTKSFGRLPPGSGCCRCRGFWFKLKLWSNGLTKPRAYQL